MSKDHPWPSATEARSECKGVLGAVLVRTALELCFSPISKRRRWEEEAAAWRELHVELKAIGRRLATAGRIAKRPRVSRRHPEFVQQLVPWIEAGRDLVRVAASVEPLPSPSKIVDHETSRIADRLVALDAALRRSSASPVPQRREYKFNDEIAVLLDVIAGTVATPRVRDSESWDKLHEKWHKALARARKRSRRQQDMTSAERRRLIDQESDLYRSQLPARPPPFAKALSDVRLQMPPEEELLYWSVRDDPGETTD